MICVQLSCRTRVFSESAGGIPLQVEAFLNQGLLRTSRASRYLFRPPHQICPNVPPFSEFTVRRMFCFKDSIIYLRKTIELTPNAIFAERLAYSHAVFPLASGSPSQQLVLGFLESFIRAQSSALSRKGYPSKWPVHAFPLLSSRPYCLDSDFPKQPSRSCPLTKSRVLHYSYTHRPVRGLGFFPGPGFPDPDYGCKRYPKRAPT